MARAKRTARADARRRYRAATEPALDTDVEAVEAPEERTAVRRPQSAAKAEPPQGRVGIFDAVRIATHRPNFREDLATLPSLLTHPALWLPVLITILGSVVVAVVGIGQSSIVGLLAAVVFQFFLFPPSLGGPFVAGFLAPRASWLLGAIVGLVSAVCYSVIILAFPLAVTTKVPDAALTQSAVLSSFVLSPVVSAVFAAAAAWYRRFLRLSNPNRSRQAAPPRRGDGRTRGASSSQKAGARR